MSVHISKNAELFFKALEDIWVAEQTWYGSPNKAIYDSYINLLNHPLTLKIDI